MKLLLAFLFIFLSSTGIAQFQTGFNRFGFGLGVYAENIPQVVTTVKAAYLNNALTEIAYGKRIDHEGSVGLMGDFRYGASVTPAWQLLAKLSGGLGMAMNRLTKNSDHTEVAPSGTTFLYHQKRTNNTSFYRVNLLNYLGTGKVKLIIAGEYEAKHIDYGYVSINTQKNQSNVWKYYDTAFTTGKLHSYHYGAGISFGSPGKLNADLMLERAGFGKVTLNTPFDIRSNYRILLNFWKINRLNFGGSISSLQRFSNAYPSFKPIYEDYKKQTSFEIHLLYNKDWLRKKG